MQRDMHTEEVEDPVADGQNAIWKGFTGLEIAQWVIVGCIGWLLNEAINAAIPTVGNTRLVFFTILVGGGYYFIHNRKTNNLVGWQRAYVALRYRLEKPLHTTTASRPHNRLISLPTTPAPPKAAPRQSRVTASADSGLDSADMRPTTQEMRHHS